MVDLVRRCMISLLVLAAACGPSAGQVREAREARYVGARAPLLDAIATAIRADREVAAIDWVAGTVTTRGQYHARTGTPVPRRDHPNHDRIYGITLVARVVGEAPPYQVLVGASVLEFRPGWKEVRVKQLPEWARGQVEDLQIALYQRLADWRLSAPSGP